MTYDAGDDSVAPERSARSGNGARVVTWIVAVALALIAVNIGIAAVGPKKKKVAAPTPIVTARPTAEAPSATPSNASPSASPAGPVTSSSVAAPPVDIADLAPEVPLPAPGVTRALYPHALGALTADDDLVLVDADSGRRLRTLVTHQPGSAIRDISWDALRSVMYFSRAGECPTVWRYRLDLGREELFARGTHPVVSPEGERVAVLGTGCGPGGQQVQGLALYESATGLPILWTPIGVGGTPALDAGSTLTDADWQPDGAAIVVTAVGAGNSRHRLVRLDVGPADLAAAEELELAADEASYLLEYAVGRVLVVSSCCPYSRSASLMRLGLADPAAGTLTPLLQTGLISLAADPRGQVRYLDGDAEQGGKLHAAILSPKPVPSAALTSQRFLRIDW